MELEYIDLNKVLSECISVNEDSIVNLKIYVENLTLTTAEGHTTENRSNTF